MNNRRKIIFVLGASVFMAPLAASAQQQGKVWRVGFLSQRARPDSLDSDPFGGFARGMRELGYIEGKNLEIQWRYAESKLERLPSLATELVMLKVDVIVTSGAPATDAAQKATATIPIVMGSVGDPIGRGFIKSLAHPGGHTTGLVNLNQEIGPKRLEMLLSTVPKLARVAVLVNPDNAPVELLNQIQSAAQRTNVKGLPVDARTSQEIEKASSLMVREKIGAVIVAQDPFLIQQRRQIAELAAQYRLPSIAGIREYAESGGLMSYGSNLSEIYRRAAIYVDKILKGAKPADLPVEQPTKFELIINGKTARALGLKIPQSLLISADRVIE